MERGLPLPVGPTTRRRMSALGSPSHDTPRPVFYTMCTLSMCIYACMCMCVCARERERESKRGVGYIATTHKRISRVLQRVAACCSVLQRIAVCCSVQTHELPWVLRSWRHDTQRLVFNTLSSVAKRVTRPPCCTPLHVLQCLAVYMLTYTSVDTARHVACLAVLRLYT